MKRIRRALFCGLLCLCSFSLSSQTLLKIDSIAPPDNLQWSIRQCGNPQLFHTQVKSKLHNLKFEINGNDVDVKTDSILHNGSHYYFLCIPVDSADYDYYPVTVSYNDKENEKTKNLYFDSWYEIKKKKDIPKLIKETSHIAIQIGKGNTYSPISGGLGVSALWRFGDKVGWGIQGGIGWYSIDKGNHAGVEIVESNYTKELTANFLHGSLGLKCYPLYKSKNTLIKGMSVMASYGTLGTKKFPAYNNLDGSFSLGGTRTMHGFTIMAGEDCFLSIGKMNFIVSGGIGAARSLNLGKKENLWRFAFDVGIGFYFKTKQK
ncbi:MAG: hypothetical protein LBV71_12160 [Prevotella sp.]|jgi:hypothetical protein|nr:hypothetical protein [Prevotella sp.]